MDEQNPRAERDKLGKIHTAIYTTTQPQLWLYEEKTHSLIFINIIYF